MAYLRFSFWVLFVGLICFVAACSSKRSATTSSAPSLSKAAKTRQLIIQEAEKLKGVPYRAAGKDPRGFDCSGFTYYIYKKHDILLSSSSGAQSKQGKEISIAKAQNGDLLFFGPDGRNGRIQHVGLVYKNTSEGLYMIHSSSKRGIVVDNISTSKYWKPKLLFARRVLPN